jgi:type I restriction enzyme M protein
MLDSITKKRIDDLRNILVGKIPSPQSQVEQITTGLIYKFMYDMDQEAVEMGGIASFFVNDFEKYSWKNLFDPKLSGVQKVQLYGDAIEHMYTNPTAPQLFREIFKNSFLPFKDPATLNMFLKEINEFHYSHSEKLGDAFEYLLSFMGSQGDAGQFRTPRHIIDFIVDVINPQKDESILDPACGTAGFLISSYKHILEQNTDKKNGDQLTASERKRIGENLVGYDISPDMTRISLVNMYLHQFASPEIHEYDTLSSEDRWNEYYDVILANPPFFSPTGGIQPHSRFGVQSTRAEVLFVDYIMEHLKPMGRAGIIIPEGIIFQAGKAYKALRKKLIEDSLVGVISLPAGVFQPYSAVKTSILILDKEKSKKMDNIFFAKIENDGFSLGAQRNPITKNDIPEILESLLSGAPSNKINHIAKIDLLSSPIFSLNGNAASLEENHSNFDLVKIEDVADIRNGYAFKSELYQSSGYRVIRITNVQCGKIEDSDPKFHARLSPSDHEKYELLSGDILISLTGNVGRVGKITPDFLPAYLNQRVCRIQVFEPNKILNDYLFWILNNRKFELSCIENSSGVAQKNLSTNWIKDYQFPLPDLDTQFKIVSKLNKYQKIIDGCTQVIENCKPTIEIDPSWELVEFEKIILENLDSRRVPITKSDRQLGSIPYYGASGIVDYVSGHIFDEDLLLISEDGANLKDRNYPIAFSISGKSWVNNHAHVLKFKDPCTQKYIEYYFNQISLEPYLTGAAQPKLNQGTLNSIKIPLPPIRDMNSIVEIIEEEKYVVSGNMQLIEIYKNKIQEQINALWGEI